MTDHLRDTPPGVEQRRASREATRNVREARACPNEFELREAPNGTGGTDLVFTGYASVTGRAYEMADMLGEFREEVQPGAFAKTLNDGADVAFLLNHGGMTLARTKAGTLRLAEHTEGDITGLHSEARLDLGNPTVVAIRSAIDRGDLSEMSFAFRVTRQRWDWAEDTGADMDHRTIQEVSMQAGDVSVVNYGANPFTGGTVAVRSRDAAAMDWRALVVTLAEADAEVRAGKTLSDATLDYLNAALGHLGDADTAAARAQIQTLISTADPGQTGAAGNTETEGASPNLQAAVAVALIRAREKDGRGRAS